jgi:hypothetical protein
MSWLGELVLELVATRADDPVDKALRKHIWLRWLCYGLLALLVGVLLGTFAADYFW